jgi:hypothetical protein
MQYRSLRRLSPEEYKNREWSSPAFGIPKKNGNIWLIIDFQSINKYIIRREFPLSTTEEILTSIKGFTYASSLDLNMGYPSIPLDKEAQNILTIITPFGAYQCLTLPMGVMPASDIFQARMVDLFANMGKNRPYPYINDILHFKGDTFEEHIEILCKILKLLTKMGMQISVKKVAFVRRH